MKSSIITICIYLESKEKINFRKISSFIKKEFGFRTELTRLKASVTQTEGLIFNPIATLRSFEKEKGVKKSCDVELIITDKLIATYENTDRRLHLRAAIYGFPSVISTSGIVEAPAKPKDYYLYKQKYSQLKIWELKEAEVKRRFKNRFIDYGDGRLSEVIKGYIAQAIFFHFTGEPFCRKKNCRLFNAHWQEYLIKSQIKSGKFCREHKEMIKLSFAKSNGRGENKYERRGVKSN